MDPSAVIRALYVAILEREPDAQEVSNWLGGASREERLPDIIKAFLDSQERQRLESSRGPKQKLGIFRPPGHFYSPLFDGADDERFYVDPDTVPLTGFDTGVELSPARYETIWRRMAPYLREIDFPKNKVEGGARYFWDNSAFGMLDATVLYGMLRSIRPRKFIEVGSGYSSALLMDVMDRFPDWDVDVTLIEPYPELVLSLLGDSASKVKILEQPIQAVDLSVFQALGAGDILFIDSSHVAKAGSDVNDEFFRVLPSLAPGVVIHIHDIFYPFEYFRTWTVEQKRSWNEAYLVRAFLLGNPNYRVNFFTDHFQRLQDERFYDTYPQLRRQRGGSLWIEKVAV